MKFYNIRDAAEHIVAALVDQKIIHSDAAGDSKEQWLHDMFRAILKGEIPAIYEGRQIDPKDDTAIIKMQFSEIRTDDLNRWLFSVRSPVRLLEERTEDCTDDGANPPKKKITPMQQDKLDCQKIARKLWAENPIYTKVRIIASDELMPYRNKYKGKNTLSDWLREIDPRPIDARRGAPKKCPSSSK